MLTNRVYFTTHRGYSLIELIITIVVTSIVMVIFFSIFGKNQLQSTSPVIQVKAAQLGQAYLEEISLKAYDENSPVGNARRCNSGVPAPSCSGAPLGSDSETRIQFDDVDDYNGLSESPPRDAFNQIRTGFSSFSVNISVTYAGTDFSLPLQSLKKIEVTVTPPEAEGGLYVFTQYRGNF